MEANSRRLLWWFGVGPLFGAATFGAFGAGVALGLDGAIIGAVLGALGGFVTACIGTTLIRASAASGATPTRRRDVTIGAITAGGLAAAFGLWVLAESDHTPLAVLLILIAPTTLAASEAALAAAWIWRRTHT